jgi:hypothetical protein
MGEQKIADVGTWKVRSDSNALGNPKDDATLMSASKDMLAALEQLLEAVTNVTTSMEDLGYAERRAESAIKKARGQT